MRYCLLHILGLKHWSRLAALAVVSVLLFACSETPVPDNQGVEWVALKLRVAPTFEVSTRAISTDVQDNSFDDWTKIGVFILDDDDNSFATATGSNFSIHKYLKYENLKYTYSAANGSLTFADADVAEFTVKEGSRITKHPVKDLGLPKGTTIGGLIRNGEGVVVMGNTLIQPGDHVVVFCLSMMIKKIEKFFN